MSLTVQASDGTPLPIDDLPQVLAYTTISSNPYLSTITVVFGLNTYVQTYTYTGTNLTGISRWVKQ